MRSLNRDPFERPPVVGEGANHSTRGRVRSPFNCMVTAEGGPAAEPRKRGTPNP